MATLKRSGVVSITTDFGIKDGNVAAMKGVIWTINPDARIADVSHLVPPQQIAAGSRIIAKRAGYFPAGSIHIVVVDPGVGTARRPLAARIGEQFFVGPDNGVFTPMLQAAGSDWQAVQLTERGFWLPKISNVFHGRDIFAPVAAHLSRGVELETLGTPIDDPVLLPFARAERLEDGSLRGEIVEIDHFGNLTLNIEADEIAHLGQTISVIIGDTTVEGVYPTFGSRSPGELLAFIDSSDSLAVAVVNGNAAQQLGARIGQAVGVKRRA